MSSPLKLSTPTVPTKLKRGFSAPKVLSEAIEHRKSSKKEYNNNNKKEKAEEPSKKPVIEAESNVDGQGEDSEAEESSNKSKSKGKYRTFLDEIVGVAIYVDYKVKKLMEREIDHLRAMQEKLCWALLEKGKVVEELETENKSLLKQLKDVQMERDILRKKLEYEREYARIILDIDD